MIIAGFMSLSLISFLGEMFGETVNSIVVPLCLLLLGLTLGGGSCAFQKKYYWWALAGAICSLLFPLTGIPAIILLVKSKGEFKP